MPPKQRITREMILEKAFDMFCQEGMDAVNARSVAKALNCSTQPIFSYYTGMQELRATLDLKAQELFAKEVLEAANGEHALVELCTAFVLFACKHPHVYRHLYESVCDDKQRLLALVPLCTPMKDQVREKEGLSEEATQDLFKRMTVYCTGLAAVAIVGLFDTNSTRDIVEKAYTVAVASAR
ncbi:MAG: TetR/AcrR family transcriptional regulator [Clostridia bacterium]|nr:TetR/AcrR family transcriptional regulator [Clostridia bacterium]